MIVRETDLAGVVILEPARHGFAEVYPLYWSRPRDHRALLREDHQQHQADAEQNTNPKNHQDNAAPARFLNDWREAGLARCLPADREPQFIELVVVVIITVIMTYPPPSSLTLVIYCSSIPKLRAL